MMGEKEIIELNLRQYFEKNGNKKTAILPLINMSGMVSDVLKKTFGIQERFIVDNNAFDMKHIYPMDRMPDDYHECVFLLAAFGNTKKVLREQLLQYVPEEQIVDLMYDEEREKVFESDSKVHLDFLCPGFIKCGTTSLHSALAQIPSIYLPAIKETYFLRYSVTETAHETFKSLYKEEDIQGKIVGQIEPAYRSHAEDVYRYFDRELKLVFCVRNPINTLYSDFKMEMRNEGFMMGSDYPGEEMMEGFERITPEVFDGWAKKYKYRELYSDYIRLFADYYPMEQIKILICEELYSDTENQMESLQDFLKIPNESRIKFTEFPRENTGNKVAKDQKSLELNRSLWQLRRRFMRKGDVQSFNMVEDIGKGLEEFTMVDYNEPMWESTRRELLDFYMDSIRELEDMLGRTLQGMWY